MEYLYDWSQELFTARTYHTEHGPNGTMLTVPDALTYPAIEAWARLTDRSPSPIEVDALFRLDVITRFPDEKERDDAAEG